MSALSRAVAVAASIILVLLTSGAADAGVRPGTAEGAELVKTGWWWAGNDTPLDTTAVAPPQPTPPNVPKGALPVSSAGGDPEKFSALEFRIAAKPGGLVEEATLVLRENTEPGATVNAEGAKIVACPVVESFWADGASAGWKARPTYDCDLASAPGERDAKTGLWTFDLVSVASLWLVEDHKGSPSVALVEAADAPESFQVAFDGPALEGVGYRFSVGDPLPTVGLPPTGGSPSDSGAAMTGGVASGGSAPVGGGSGAAPLAGAPDVAPAAGVPAQEPAVAEPVAAETAPMASPAAAPPWYSGLPAGGYVVLLLALGLAYLTMLALGPDAQPAAGQTQHGVSRALERLRSAAAATTSKVRR